MQEASTALTVVGDVRPNELSAVAHYFVQLGPGSHSSVKSALNYVARFFGGCDFSAFPWERLRYEHVHALRAALSRQFAPKTCNVRLCAVRGVLRQAWKLGQMSHEDYHRAVSVESVRGYREPAGRALTQGELRSLFGACDLATIQGSRDAALLSLLYGCGLRRSEAQQLDLGDVEGNRVLVRRAKGNKDRVVYLPAGGSVALDAWLAVRGREPGPLLLPLRCGRYGATGVQRRRMHSDTVRAALRSIAKRAGVRDFTPHDVRRTFVGDLIDAGLDVNSVRALAGHAQINTTAGYDRRPERARARSAELLTIPIG